MEIPRSQDEPSCAPSSEPPGSSTANLTEEDILGVGSRSGWKLDEVMDARQAMAAAAASLQEDPDRNDFLLKPWPPQKLGRVVSLGDVVAQQARISLATSALPRPRVGARHKKRKGAEASGAPEGQPQGLADLADVASIFSPEPISKRAKTGVLAGSSGAGKAGNAPAGEGPAPSKPPVGQKGKKYARKRQLEELPYRRADGKWTCTFSTGGMAKDRLTLCTRDNEAKRSTCKVCKAPRWDWQLRGRLAAILQHRDLHNLSRQQVIEELNEMSLVNFEGLRFPAEAIKHEVDAFLARHGQGLRQPAKVSSLPVFPRALRKGRYQSEVCQSAGTTKLEWIRNRGDAGEYEVPVEDELATNFPSMEAGAPQQESEAAQWQPLYCALLRLAHSVLQQQAAGADPGSSSDARKSHGSASQAAEDCCAFAHSLIEATLSRKWPSRLTLKKSMKGIQEHILRLHLPYPRAPSAEAPAAGSPGACNAGRCTEDSEKVEPVRGMRRPVPFSSRAALLQNPPRRPKGWSAPPLPRPRLLPSGEPLKAEQLDTSGAEASSWLLAPSYALHQVQHAFRPSAEAAPGSSAEPSSSHAAHTRSSDHGVQTDGMDSTTADRRKAGSQRVPTFGQWGSAFHAAVAHAALPAPDVTQATAGLTQGPPGPGTHAPQKAKFQEREARTDGSGVPGEDSKSLPEAVNYRHEWKRRLLQKLQQPKVQGLAGMEEVKRQARLVFQAAAVLGVRHEIIESAIRKFNSLQRDESPTQ